MALAGKIMEERNAWEYLTDWIMEESQGNNALVLPIPDRLLRWWSLLGYCVKGLHFNCLYSVLSFFFLFFLVSTNCLSTHCIIALVLKIKQSTAGEKEHSSLSHLIEKQKCHTLLILIFLIKHLALVRSAFPLRGQYCIPGKLQWSFSALGTLLCRNSHITCPVYSPKTKSSVKSLWPHCSNSVSGLWLLAWNFRMKTYFLLF